MPVVSARPEAPTGMDPIRHARGNGRHSAAEDPVAARQGESAPRMAGGVPGRWTRTGLRPARERRCGARELPEPEAASIAS